MKDFILVQHASGAPGLRFLGMGPRFMPKRGIKKLQVLLDRNTSWATKRNKHNIRRMLSKSDAIVSVWKGNKLIGFGRATSDRIYRAVLWDIVVEKSYQRSGVGKLIVTSLLSNRLIANAEKIYVMTTEFAKFYKRMGFQLEKNQNLMLLLKNNP